MDNKIVVGLHIGHDRSSSIVKNGKLLGSLAEERVDRIKHSPSTEFPLISMYKLLDFLNLDINSIKYFAITYAFVEIDSIIDTLEDELKSILNRNDISVMGISHHLSHAYSTYFTSPFNKSLIVVADGAGDIVNNKVEAESVYIADKTNIKLVEQRLQDIPSSYAERRTFYNYPYILENDYKKQISLSRKYEQITYLVGFKWGQAGKTMGLAPYGEQIIKLDKVFNKNSNIDLTLDDLLVDIDKKINLENKSYQEYITENKKHLCKTMQLLLEEIVIEYLNNLYKKI